MKDHRKMEVDIFKQFKRNPEVMSINVIKVMAGGKVENEIKTSHTKPVADII
jgi:hypothetical protein